MRTGASWNSYYKYEIFGTEPIFVFFPGSYSAVAVPKLRFADL
jgi:hypothetical protein